MKDTLIHYAPHIGLCLFIVGLPLYVRYCKRRNQKLDLMDW